MPRKKTLKCPKCSRMFSMPAHVARHLNMIHGAARRSNAKGRMRARKMQRASLAISRLGLQTLSLEQLRDVMDAARSEAQERLRELQSVFE